MGKPRAFRLESAGWGFWAVTVAILTGPSIYLANLLIEEHYTWDVPTGIGLIAAAILGAVITVIANTIIQRVAEKKKAAMKKQSQKKK